MQLRSTASFFMPLLTTTFLSVPLAVVPLATTLTTAQPAAAATDYQKTLQESSQVFQEIMQGEKTRIPARLLRRSQAIAIIPDVTQAGFIFGGRRGTGVMMTRNADGSWSNPVFVNVTGGSFGLQVGAKSTDMVLLFPNRASLNNVINGKSLELGGNVTGTAGTSEGTAVETLDDRTGGDKIFAFSRSSGLFGGAAFEGAKLEIDNKKNQEFYG
ncbi:MAG TPA: lipid-binding SYLF domain-containing protein, partial [Stenomitos sp.]